MEKFKNQLKTWNESFEWKHDKSLQLNILFIIPFFIQAEIYCTCEMFNQRFIHKRKETIAAI